MIRLMVVPIATCKTCGYHSLEFETDGCGLYNFCKHANKRVTPEAMLPDCAWPVMENLVDYHLGGDDGNSF